MVYISILEQQAKYGDALEILCGKLGSLLVIEVDKLRIQVLCEDLIIWNINAITSSHTFLFRLS